MIGRRVVEQLRVQGRRIRVLQRSADEKPRDVDVVVGDLASDESLHVLLDGADCVFHCAAELHDIKRMHDVNVLATERLAQVAMEQGVKRFIHMSSAGVTGPSDQAWIDEALPCHPYNSYEVSKCKAEQVLSSLSDSGMRICMLRPTNVIDDDRPGVLAMASRNVWRDQLSLLIKGDESAHLVHAEDVAEAALFLAENDSCYGACFVGCDEDDRNTVAGVFNLARRKMGRTEYHGPVFPAAVPYYLRSIGRGKSLHGRTRFSSAKLIDAGFEFSLGLDGAVERICNCQMLKQ